MFHNIDSIIQGILTHYCSTIFNLRVQIAHQDEKIVTLENEIFDLKYRMSDPDHYSSKDFLYFSYFPLSSSSNTLPIDV